MKRDRGGWNETPNEECFHRVIGQDLNAVSGRQLRMEEEAELDSREPITVKELETESYRIDDYRRLCRGMEVVSRNI